MQLIPGPDFPTAGSSTGARASATPTTPGAARSSCAARPRSRRTRTAARSIIVTEIPYKVNKARLVEKIAELVKEKQLEGISDIRDESDRDGMRIVFELHKDAVPAVVLNQLYRMTPLQSTFGVIMLAIVDGRPQGPDAQGRARRTSSSTAATWSRAARSSSCKRGARAPGDRRGPGHRRRQHRSRHPDHPRRADARRGQDQPDGRAARRPRGVPAPRRPARGRDRASAPRRGDYCSPSGRRRRSSTCASRA